jgi:hypothetical protein
MSIIIALIVICFVGLVVSIFKIPFPPTMNPLVSPWKEMAMAVGVYEECLRPLMDAVDKPGEWIQPLYMTGTAIYEWTSDELRQAAKRWRR